MKQFVDLHVHTYVRWQLFAYGIDLKNEKLVKACAYNQSLLKCMAKDGMAVSEEEYHGYEIPKSQGGDSDSQRGRWCSDSCSSGGTDSV